MPDEEEEKKEVEPVRPNHYSAKLIISQLNNVKLLQKAATPQQISQSLVNLESNIEPAEESNGQVEELKQEPQLVEPILILNVPELVQPQPVNEHFSGSEDISIEQSTERQEEVSNEFKWTFTHRSNYLKDVGK